MTILTHNYYNKTYLLLEDVKRFEHFGDTIRVLFANGKQEDYALMEDEWFEVY